MSSACFFDAPHAGGERGVTPQDGARPRPLVTPVVPDQGSEPSCCPGSERDFGRVATVVSEVIRVVCVCEGGSSEIKSLGV